MLIFSQMTRMLDILEVSQKKKNGRGVSPAFSCDAARVPSPHVLSEETGQRQTGEREGGQGDEENAVSALGHRLCLKSYSNLDC